MKETYVKFIDIDNASDKTGFIVVTMQVISRKTVVQDGRGI